MIGRLAGQIIAIGADHVLIDVRGVGYEVHISDRTRAGLPGVGEVAVLYTDLLVREDLMQLFGFATLAERDWHRVLMTVQGIGAKASMAILGTLGADGIARAITLGDPTAIRAAPGVGPKIAQRVVLELKSKAPALMARATPDTPPPPLIEVEAATPRPAVARPARTAPATSQTSTSDAMSALANLGYGPSEAAAAVARATADGAGDTAAVIRAALALLQPRG